MHVDYCIGALSLPDHRHISLGPGHPSQSGFLAVRADVEDGRWQSVRIRPGYGHRAAEKLFEVRDYRSAIMLADRHDWWSATTGELCVTLAIERAMRLVPPPRATWLRTVLAETARLHSHLAFLSVVPDDAGPLWQLVDDLRAAVLAWSGNRVHPMLQRIGGLAHDVPQGWALPLDAVRRLADDLERALDRTDRFRGLAVLTADDCRDFGLSGPVSRAAGLDLDRRHDPDHLAHAHVFHAAPTRTAGDGHARLAVLVDDLRASADMLDALLAGLRDHPGDVAVRLARRVKVPEGEHWAEIEAPWGIAGCLLVSRGGPTPWRLALRTPSFANVAALERALVGVAETDIADAVATVGYSVGDVDK
ncbi:NADH-quinone oxidoreductase subunit D [uncultured Tessaracoccus sp.]|uniref:NADH-quinone oxidoreductase subunit D-related protein n=1 Tax=uncultured Tessaracoccus sp. TaxID=905023 RepID=UPI0025FC6F35|nr:NADH-quinone oxidoreductase subunit D [uncultured Tessaracoccus sp.]